MRGKVQLRGHASAVRLSKWWMLNDRGKELLRRHNKVSDLNRRGGSPFIITKLQEGGSIRVRRRKSMTKATYKAIIFLGNGMRFPWEIWE